MMFENLKHDYYNAFSKNEILHLDNEYHQHSILRFYIYGDELKLPVFHIIPGDMYTDICICLFKPNFYKYVNRMNVNYMIDVNAIDKLLREPNKKANSKSNWEALVEWWIQDHNDCKYSRVYKQPDYTKLNDNKIIKRSFVRTLAAKWYA